MVSYGSWSRLLPWSCEHQLLLLLGGVLLLLKLNTFNYLYSKYSLSLAIRFKWINSFIQVKVSSFYWTIHHKTRWERLKQHRKYFYYNTVKSELYRIAAWRHPAVIWRNWHFWNCERHTSDSGFVGTSSHLSCIVWVQTPREGAKVFNIHRDRNRSWFNM